jgi:hypothetical protein
VKTEGPEAGPVAVVAMPPKMKAQKKRRTVEGSAQVVVVGETGWSGSKSR